MTLEIEQLSQPYAARFHGVDIRKPIDGALLSQIRAALATYSVAIIGHDVPPSDEEHIAFSRMLGPVERGKEPKLAGTGQRVRHPEIIDQSNLDEVGEIYADNDRRLAFKRANRLWHTDMSFYEIRATYSLLSAHVVPPAGADTEFVDMRDVYDALDEERRRAIEDLTVEHSYWHSRVLGGGPPPTAEEKMTRAPARHKMVHVHEPSGRKTLYIASHACGIVGWEQDKALALINELMAFATQPRFVFAHQWKVGDVLIWDNMCTMHRATPFDDTKFRRDVRRTTCRERVIENETMSIA